MDEKLINYYNKHNEDKRLKTKHGSVEFLTTMKYIHDYLKEGIKILDVGAGMGAYSIPLNDEGYDVTAVELVKHNLKEIEKHGIKCIHANATNLSMIDDNSYDLILLFGPLYHLQDMNDKIKALEEAKRIVKKDGIILISYCMNEYAILTHGFKENNIKESIDNDLVDENYKIIKDKDELYSYVRLEDINYLKDITKLERIKIISQDGPAEYYKELLNNMNDDEFNLFLDYHINTCERKELLGAGRHILDILKKVD